MTDFNLSKTKENLMKAFAGESMARNRYTFSAEAAAKQELHVIEAVFTYTANQEKVKMSCYLSHRVGKILEIEALKATRMGRKKCRRNRYGLHPHSRKGWNYYCQSTLTKARQIVQSKGCGQVKAIVFHVNVP